MSNPRVYKIRRRAKLTRRLYGPVSRSTFQALFFIILATALYSGSFASSFRSRRPESAAKSEAKFLKAVPTNAKQVVAILPSSTAALLMVAPQLTEETIVLYAANCTTPKTSFNFGDTVCAKIEGGPDLTDAPRSIIWASPDGLVLQSTQVTNLGDSFTFAIPARDANDFRAVWRVMSVSPWYQARTATAFNVSDPGDATADLAIYDNINFNTSTLAGGQDAEYTLWIVNNGPDDATNVSIATTGSNSSFQSAEQTFGPNPEFDCTATPGTCTIASLPAGTKAAIRLVYQASGSPGTLVSTTATITSATTDARTLNNSSTASATIAVAGTDDTCTLECPNDITVTATHTEAGQPGANVDFEVESAGDCGTVSSSPSSGSFFPVGTTTVNTSGTGGGSCSFRVHVIDPATLPAPTITCAANQTATAAAGELEAVVSVNQPATGGTVLSVVGVRSDGVSRQISDPYPVGETTITWTARDQAADDDGQFPALTRSASCTQKIIVGSADAPTISCSTDKTYDAASGACDRTLTSAEIGEPTTTGTGVTVEGRRSDNRSLSDPFSVGTTTVTWTATDSIGRVVSCSHNITIRASGPDNTPPVLNVPADVEVFTDSCTAVVDDELGVATATDSCGGGVQITRTGVPTGPVIIRRRFPLPPLVVIRETFIFPVGTTTITYTATDAAGNITTGTQRVVVKERTVTPPSIQAPPDLTLYTGAGATSCGLNVSDATLGTATASDNCPGVTVARTGVPAGNNFPKGTTQVTYTATDASGNTAFDVQNVTVIDNTPPTLSVPADITVYLPLNSTATSRTVSYTVTADDNCPDEVLNVSPASGSVFNVGTTQVMATVTDAAGNVTSATFNVTVLYNFTGFFQPVGNLPALNIVNAGKAIPVKFSLSGNKGLGIFAANSPYTVALDCGSGAGVDVEETLTAGSSSLTYNSTSDQYHYVWKTESSWAGTCRQLVVKLNDGSEHRANFKFK